MSITIRLARIGKKNSPAYKIVVTNTRDKRNGRTLGILGHFNPTQTPVSYDLNKTELNKWVKQGALLTDAVKKLMDGKYVYIPYRTKKAAETKEYTQE